MSETAIENTDEAATSKSSKKGLIIMILVTILAVGAGAGGAWFYFQDQLEAAGEAAEPKPIPTTFKELDTFTVNLQPEERSQYLQLGLTVKIHDIEEVALEIDRKMPEIRNRILLQLTSKTAEEISTLPGKKQLGSELTA